METNGSLWKVLLGSLGAFVVGTVAMMRAVLARRGGRERDREAIEALRRDVDRLTIAREDDRRLLERLVTTEQIRSKLEGPSR